MHVHLSVLSLLLVACSGDPKDGEPTIPDLPPKIEIGTGETAFEPLEDGDTIYIVYGPQGGYHFNGSLRGKWVLTGGMGGMGGAQPLAATMNEAAMLCVELGDPLTDGRQRPLHADQDVARRVTRRPKP